MAGLALSTIGVKFGWGLGTLTTPPTTWTQVEECTNIGSVELSKEKMDATPLESKRRKYTGGHEDTGGELQTTFNASDVFEKQWGELLAADAGKTSGKVMWFCAYHPIKEKMNVYIVEPGSIPAPEYSVGGVLQYAIKNTLIDLPDQIMAVEPTVQTE